MNNEHTHPPIVGCLVPEEWVAEWQNCHISHNDSHAYMEDDDNEYI